MEMCLESHERLASMSSRNSFWTCEPEFSFVLLFYEPRSARRAIARIGGELIDGEGGTS